MSRYPDSNRGPTHYECVALPTEPYRQSYKSDAKITQFFDLTKNIFLKICPTGYFCAFRLRFLLLQVKNIPQAEVKLHENKIKQDDKRRAAQAKGEQVKQVGRSRCHACHKSMENTDASHQQAGQGDYDFVLPPACYAEQGRMWRQGQEIDDEK